MKKPIGIVCLVLLTLVVAPTAAATIYVDDDGGDGVYLTIQAAIDAAIEGDTIYVFPGNYSWFPLLKPNLTITGAGADLVTVDMTGLSFEITGNKTTCEGLTIFKPSVLYVYGQDCIIRNSIFDGITGSSAMYIETQASNCTFANNTIKNLTGTTSGLDIKGGSVRIINNTFVNIPAINGALYIRTEATNATIESNRFENCTGTRPLTLRSVGCTIANNTFKENTGDAMRIWGYKGPADNNIITGNSFGDTAIWFRDSGDGNRIYLNNNISGVVLYSGSPVPNTIYWNATEPVTYIYNGAEYTGYPGNFWSSYTGEDTDGDGIIDTPNVLPSGLGTDYEPLVGAWSDGVILGGGAAAPTAAFTADVTSGTAPLTVQFTDQSTGDEITSWAWDFENDGTVDSTDQSPSHIYDTAGTYTVNLTVTNAGGSDSEVKTDYITVSEAALLPVLNTNTGLRYATIQAAVSAATAGDEILVGDGTYTENVNVDRQLAIRSENGTASVTVTAASPALPVFDVNANGVEIQGFSVRGPTNEHVAGIEIIGFNDCLIAGNDCAGCYNGIHIGGTGTNNTIEGNYCHENTRRGISVRDSAHDNVITRNIMENNTDAGLCIKDTAAGNTVWLNDLIGNGLDIGTANRAYSPDPITYTYNTGTYTGYLGNYYSTYAGTDANGDGVGDTAFTSGSSWTDSYPLMASFANYAETEPTAPTAAFTADPLSGTAPLTVQFTDQSSGTPPLTYAWDFENDGTVDSTSQSPSHVYTAAGTYTVNLTVTNAAGSDDEVKTDYITVTVPEGTVLSVDPAAASVLIGKTTTVQVVIGPLPTGLAGYNLTLGLSDPAIAEITGLALPGWAPLNSTSGLPADQLVFSSVDLSKAVEPGAGATVLADITLRGDAPGTTDLHLGIGRIDADGGDPILATILNGALTVFQVEPFPGYTNRPTDPDGDGLYEDINGNGMLDFDDVVAFYQNMAWVIGNTFVGIEPYDFNGNGRIDYDDIVVLYYEVLGG